ncbi:hypothetical protein BS78_06G040100 [Paspalum vaginatum]|nr:hypothetical protein BS78_06G040100 [Paspalum vaginatum]
MGQNRVTIRASAKPRAARPISLTLSTRRHLGPPLAPTISPSPPRCHVPFRSTAAESPMPMRAAELYYFRPHTPHPSALALLARPHPSGYPPRLRLRLRLRPAPPSSAPPRPPQGSNTRASPSPPPTPFFPSGARQIHAPHADLRHCR